MDLYLLDLAFIKYIPEVNASIGPGCEEPVLIPFGESNSIHWEEMTSQAARTLLFYFVGLKGKAVILNGQNPTVLYPLLV